MQSTVMLLHFNCASVLRTIRQLTNSVAPTPLARGRVLLPGSSILRIHFEAKLVTLAQTEARLIAGPTATSSRQ